MFGAVYFASPQLSYLGAVLQQTDVINSIALGLVVQVKCSLSRTLSFLFLCLLFSLHLLTVALFSVLFCPHLSCLSPPPTEPSP